MLRKLVNVVRHDPMIAPIRIWSYIYLLRLSRKKNIKIESELYLNGHPLIDIRKGCSLYIGHQVTLNSRNKGYHINMHSPVKLFADREGAEIRIGDRTRIHGSCIHAYKSIEIGSNCLIAANCQIFDCSGHDLSFDAVENRIYTTGQCKQIKIEDSVWIGANSIVLPGVTIGRGSVISVNSVVTKDVPPFVLAGGNPARIIKNHEYKCD